MLSGEASPKVGDRIATTLYFKEVGSWKLVTNLVVIDIHAQGHRIKMYHPLTGSVSRDKAGFVPGRIHGEQGQNGFIAWTFAEIQNHEQD